MLPRWLRQWMAYTLVAWSDEIGGVLHDYKNGRWLKLAKWDSADDSDSAMEIIWNMLQSGHDDIYIACVKSEGFGRGYFAVYDSNCDVYRRDFWMGLYDPDEAMMDVGKHCRKVADKMGYRRLDDI
jgi:hypothetical protein